MDRGRVYYARADGSLIRQAAFPFFSPNGIGLSPDGATLYVAETPTARLWAFDITAPGELARQPWPSPHGGITIVSPDGASVEHVPFPDIYTTNICFGGEDLRTAYLTLSSSGRLIATSWPRPGLALHHLNT